MEVIEIKDEEFENVTKEGKVLVDCYAPWCAPCKMLSPIIDEIASNNNTYKFYKLNIDDSDNVSNKYEIVSIPTMLIFEDGNLKEKITGFKSKEELEEILGD